MSKRIVVKDDLEGGKNRSMCTTLIFKGVKQQPRVDALAKLCSSCVLHSEKEATPHPLQ